MRKTLDHRTSKTYDIKPVDKRGELDVERIKEGSELVKLSKIEREQKQKELLARFKKEQKGILKESLIFDIGARKGGDVVKLREEEQVEQEEVEEVEEIKEEQVIQRQEQQKQEEEREQEAIEEVAPEKEIVETHDFEDLDSPEEVFEKFTASFKEEKEKEKTETFVAIEAVEIEQKQEQEQEVVEIEDDESDEYSVLQGNSLLQPQDAPEIKVSKFEFSGLQMINEVELDKEFASVSVSKREEIIQETIEETVVEQPAILQEVAQDVENVFEKEVEEVEEVKEVEKARFISQELVLDKKPEIEKSEIKEETREGLIENWISKETEDAEILRKRALARELQAKSDLIEKNRLEAEARKIAKREEEESAELARKEKAEESRLAWQQKFEEEQKRKAKAWVTRKNAAESQLKEEEDRELERKIEAKAKYNEPIIEDKLNAWFSEESPVEIKAKKKALVLEETPVIKASEEQVVVDEVNVGVEKVEKRAVIKKQVEKKKTEIEFTGKITKDVLEEKEKKKGFFSSNYKKRGEKGSWRNVFSSQALSFAATCFVALLIVGSVVFVSYGFQVQENVKVKGQQALGYLDEAKDQLKGQDFLSAKTSFASAVEEFEEAQQELDRIGGDMLNVFSKLPVLSRISSGKNVVDAGNELTKAAKELSGAIEVISNLDNPFGFEEGVKGEESQASMLDMFLLMQEKLTVAHESLESAEESLALVKVADLPVEYQEKFQKIKDTLPVILSMVDSFEQNSEIFLELLGHNGPRKYLLIFQNNQEMRATGGFIGSYGVLHIANGKIKKLLIEGIYNPDGQLKQNIVPPLPIQKISASWSTHDANWFPHFPKTAEKIAMFYEYTGGPTVDGIITMTPMVLQRMLEITGPIEMEDYDTTVNAENFVQATQYEVEVDYDKTENKPKQFLADLAPKIITNLLESKDPEDASGILEMFSDMLKERHIMIHSFSDEVQDVVSKRGWSGEILQTEKDYLMVVNSNINGFKTDGVVDEDISHSSKIAEDGTITNTIKIKRVHNGGDTDYEWWNKVNCDYMRVYVPKGSKLVSVKGQTREINEPPLDYDKLGFKRDEDVVAEEESIELDDETGTRVYEEEGKTVFANWVYVSPKETVEVEYVYELPFKLDLTKGDSNADTYSLLVQKQSGSVGSDFSSIVEYDTKAQPVWTYPQNLERRGNVLDVKTKLTTDLFFGTVFKGEGKEGE